MAMPISGDMTLGDLLRLARTTLRASPMPSPDLDARLLIEWVTQTSRLDAVSAPEQRIASSMVQRAADVLSRRLAGEPVHRIIGSREFYGLTFQLSPETLEPRPDTEALVDLVLPVLNERTALHGVADVIDLGTGTGAIAIALLSQNSKARAIGADISAGALATARRNAGLAGVSSRFAALETNWLENVSGQYDIIVSNPPYIPSKDIESLDVDVRAFDPMIALDGGQDGLNVYRLLAAQCKGALRQGGAVAMEIGVGQRNDIESIFDAEGWMLTSVSQDLGGHERALLFMPR